MKDLFSKEYKRRLKLVLKSKLSGKNKIMAANIWAVAILRYGAGVVDVVYVIGYMHELFVLKSRTNEVRASEGF